MTNQHVCVAVRFIPYPAECIVPCARSW